MLMWTQFVEFFSTLAELSHINWVMLSFSALFLVWGLLSYVNADCSREMARKVRNLLESEVFTYINVKPKELPLSCPLNPILDKYMEHEKHKTHEHSADWQCKYCNKRFVSEKYIDRHLERVHGHLVPANATVCLADYSKMFGFRPEVVSTLPSRLSERSMYARIKKSFGPLEKCSPSEAEKLVQQCNAISNSCFTSTVQNSKFNNLVCSNLKCVNGILKGGLYKGDEEDDVLVSRLLRILILIIIVGIIAIQDSIYNQLRAQLARKKPTVDHLHRHQQQRGAGYGWFLDTIIGALVEGKKQVLRTFKQEDKRR